MVPGQRASRGGHLLSLLRGQRGLPSPAVVDAMNVGLPSLQTTARRRGADDLAARAPSTRPYPCAPRAARTARRAKVDSRIFHPTSNDGCGADSPKYRGSKIQWARSRLGTPPRESDGALRRCTHKVKYTHGVPRRGRLSGPALARVGGRGRLVRRRRGRGAARRRGRLTGAAARALPPPRAPAPRATSSADAPRPASSSDESPNVVENLMAAKSQRAAPARRPPSQHQSHLR